MTASEMWGPLSLVWIFILTGMLYALCWLSTELRLRTNCTWCYLAIFQMTARLTSVTKIVYFGSTFGGLCKGCHKHCIHLTLGQHGDQSAYTICLHRCKSPKLLTKDKFLTPLCTRIWFDRCALLSYIDRWFSHWFSLLTRWWFSRCISWEWRRVESDGDFCFRNEVDTIAETPIVGES